MEIRNDFQENDDNAPKLVESKKKQPAITGPIKVLFLDDDKPFSKLLPSNINWFAKFFVANEMQDPVYTMIDIDGVPAKCAGSNGSYATYFSIPLCKDEQNIREVVSAINDADVIVCGKLSENILGFNFGLDTNVGPFAKAIEERVKNGFKNVIRYYSKGDVDDYLTGFKGLPSIIEADQYSYEKIFKLIKEMQPKRNFIQNHKVESSIILAMLLGLGYKLSENGSPETSRSSRFVK